jgi:hypothetical protein
MARRIAARLNDGGSLYAFPAARFFGPQLVTKTGSDPLCA